MSFPFSSPARDAVQGQHGLRAAVCGLGGFEIRPAPWSSERFQRQRAVEPPFRSYAGRWSKRSRILQRDEAKYASPSRYEHAALRSMTPRTLVDFAVTCFHLRLVAAEVGEQQLRVDHAGGTARTEQHGVGAAAHGHRAGVVGVERNA